MFPAHVTHHAGRLWTERGRYCELFRLLGLDPATASRTDSETAFLSTDKTAVAVALAQMDDLEARSLCEEMCALFDTRDYASNGEVDREPRLALMATSGDVCATALLLRLGANPHKVLSDGTTPIARVQGACLRTCGRFSLDCIHQTTKALMIDYDASNVSGGS